MIAVILLVLGVVAAAAGIVTIGFGIPVSDFSVGSTLILAGTVALSGGLVLVGLAAAVNQLSQIAGSLHMRAGARRRSSEPAEESASPATTATARPVQARGQFKAPGPAKPSTKLPLGERVPEVPAPDAEPEISASAIERLRSSVTRTDRPAGPTDTQTDAPVQAPAAVNGSGKAAISEDSKKPRLDFLFGAKRRTSPRESFDAVWPRRGQAAPDAEDGETEGPASGHADMPVRKSPPADATGSGESRSPAILKSGVVDGMAYTLYSDGSIEAKLPQGTVRFGSIAELRSHIENSS